MDDLWARIQAQNAEMDAMNASQGSAVHSTAVVWTKKNISKLMFVS